MFLGMNITSKNTFMHPNSEADVTRIESQNWEFWVHIQFYDGRSVAYES